MPHETRRRLLCIYAGFPITVLVGQEDEPVNHQEDRYQEGSCIQQLYRDQRRVGSGEEPMNGCAQVGYQAENVDRTEGLHPDPPTEIVRHGHQQGQVKADHTDAHPDWTVRGKERNQDLGKAIGQIPVKEQNTDMEEKEPDGQQRNELVKIVRDLAMQQVVQDFIGDGQSPSDGKPDEQVGGESSRTGNKPHYLYAIGCK